jgi:hypothetical protein
MDKSVAEPIKTVKPAMIPGSSISKPTIISSSPSQPSPAVTQPNISLTQSTSIPDDAVPEVIPSKMNQSTEDHTASVPLKSNLPVKSPTPAPSAGINESIPLTMASSESANISKKSPDSQPERIQSKPIPLQPKTVIPQVNSNSVENRGVPSPNTSEQTSEQSFAEKFRQNLLSSISAKYGKPTPVAAVIPPKVSIHLYSH